MNPTFVPAGAPEAPGETTGLALTEAQAQVQALNALLEEEFQALRAQSFDQLEALQSPKLALLESLSALSQAVKQQAQPPAQWEALLDTLRLSQEAWRRNEQLIQRQLEVVRNALRSMQAADPTASIELYNRMGQTSRRIGSRVFSDA